MPRLLLSRRDCLRALLVLPWLNASAISATPAQRIIAINWLAAETLLSLGITPLAVSDVGYFRRRIAEPVLPANVQDIGPFWEPNIERIDALKPTLILSDMLAPALLDSLLRIAPVQVVSVYPSTNDVWQALLTFTGDLGTKLSVCAQAARLIDHATTVLSHCQQRLGHAAGQRILVVVRSQDGKYATVYGKNSLPDAMLTRLGLQNAWNKPVGAMGTANVSIEKLASLPADWLFYTELPTTLTQFTRLRQPDGLWQQLPLVSGGRARELTHFFPFGGMATAVSLAQHITQVLSESEKNA
ncbi:Fe3+-siderophore ABC transporter substrate-binding protein [Rouxiella silvae]|uniref:ABC transporter substrate-binding protein n=1 Tax=Rouxiella silvae TaxID=1646373 RepID=A0AA40X535_9GAMM|nr:ABC transporter substrate-binding protein [Rouxiella silvae]MBF6638826.1 ABC transporter substrate-binding protein [Rouxiella silvae]ORJ22950.1 Fe3+-siderophore ABC transporter substrate-binding protein [Rouxiella silvae]